MDFDVDVSGDDLLSKDYTICIANNKKIIKGFKFSSEIINIINSKFGQEKYRYKKSSKGKANLKVRIYCVVIYYLFESIILDIKNEEINLNICKDFDRKFNDIKQNLEHFLIDKLKIKLDIDTINFCKLPKQSCAHRYSYIMRKDNKNQLQNYVTITLKQIEKHII